MGHRTETFSDVNRTTELLLPIKTLGAVAHPHVCIAQEEELVVAQSDSRQLWLLRTTSARVDPPPVRLLTNTASSQHLVRQTLPSSNSRNFKEHSTAELTLTEEQKSSSGRGSCYLTCRHVLRHQTGLLVKCE